MAETQVNIEMEMNKEEDINVEDTDPSASGKRSTTDASKKTKGRGFRQDNDREVEERYSGKSSEFETLDDEGSKTGPQRSIEGWIVFVTSIHEEAAEDMIRDKFSEFGEVKNLQMPLDRRTGFVKGYALVEFTSKDEAESAIKNLNGSEFMDQKIAVDWGFTKGTATAKGGRPRTGGRGAKKFGRS